MQPLNAMAVRPPANTPAAAANAATEPVTAESLGWQLRAALPPLRLHSVSLYDEQANVLWLSEGALGPDEHNLVLEAMETLAGDTSLPCYENGLEDGRVAIFLPVRAPKGDLVGIAMILADLKSVGDGVLERMVGPQVRSIMQKIAVLLRRTGGVEPAAGPAAGPAAAAAVLELAPERSPAPARSAPGAAQTSAATLAPVSSASPYSSAPVPAHSATALNGTASAQAASAKSGAAAAAAGKAAATQVRNAPPVLGAAPTPNDALSPQAIDDILEFELFPEQRPAEKLKPLAPAATILPPTAPVMLDSGLALELLEDSAPGAPTPEAAKKVAATSASPQARAPAPAAANAKPFASPAPLAAPANANPPTLSASAAASPTTASSSAAAEEAHEFSSDPISFDLSLDAALSPAAASGTTNSPVAADVAARPNTTSSAAPTATAVAAPPVAPSAPKSTGATTTSKALGSPAATGTARSLAVAGGTGTIQALGNPNATGTSRTLALDPTSLILEVQPFAKLRAGGRTRRYEVLARVPHRDANRASAALDGLALQRLLGWLGANRSAWNLEPTSFSLNLSISTLEDDRFPQHVASCLRANGIAADNLGFEIAESLCTQRRAQVERFITLCDKLGCFVVIDDFSFDSSILPLLRSKALRLVKIDPKLTSAALRDKLSQAMVVAIVQAVKVLGIHCSAKRVESQASLQWLTAIGCDFAQGPALSQVQPLEALALAQNASATAEPGKAG